MPLSHGPTFLANIGPDIGPYLSPTAGNLSHGPINGESDRQPNLPKSATKLAISSENLARVIGA